MFFQYSKIKVIEGDVFFIKTMSDKVIVNDSYEGLIVLDSVFNVIRRIRISPFDLFYNAIVLNDVELLLNCEEDKQIIIVNIDSGAVRRSSKPDMLQDEVLKEKISSIDGGVILKTYKNKYFLMDTVHLKFREYSYKEKNQSSHFVINEEYFNAITVASSKIYMNDKNILIKGGEDEISIAPQTGFFFQGMDRISHNDTESLVALAGSGDATMAILFMINIVDDKMII